jgi:hypothetical protein
VLQSSTSVTVFGFVARLGIVPSPLTSLQEYTFKPV